MTWERPVIEDGVPTKWGWIVRCPERLELGEHTDIGAFTYIQAEEGVEIGYGAQLGAHCAVYSVSTIDGKRGKVTIGRGAGVGANSVVMPGVTIGDLATVGACSFVNRDVPAGATVYGCPARVAP